MTVRLREPETGDVEPLVRIWTEPSVVRWWPGMDKHAVRRLVRSEDVVTRVIEVSGEVAGFIQAYEEPDPEYRHASLDLMVAERFQGRGVGPQAIRLLARELFARGHHRLTIDPAAANVRARRAYEKVGFRPVGTLRQYELDTTTGKWRDGVLYDLLEEELTPS